MLTRGLNRRGMQIDGLMTFGVGEFERIVEDRIMLMTSYLSKLFISSTFIFLLFISLFSFTDVFAKSLETISTEAEIENSDFVALVEITSIEEKAIDSEFCGFVYEAKVLATIKGGQSPTTVVKFGRRGEFKKGERYFLSLFYHDVESYKDNVGKTIGLPIERHSIEERLVECDGVIPGYLVNFSATWRLSNIVDKDK